MSCSIRAWTRLAAVLLFGALLTGCVVGPDFVAPAAPTSSRYTVSAVTESDAGMAAQGGASAAGYWWQQLQSAPLDVTVRAAVLGNRDLRAMRAALAQADALTRASDAALHPTLSLNAGLGREKLGAA